MSKKSVDTRSLLSKLGKLKEDQAYLKTLVLRSFTNFRNDTLNDLLLLFMDRHLEMYKKIMILEGDYSKLYKAYIEVKEGPSDVKFKEIAQKKRPVPLNPKIMQELKEKEKKIKKLEEQINMQRKLNSIKERELHKKEKDLKEASDEIAKTLPVVNFVKKLNEDIALLEEKDKLMKQKESLITEREENVKRKELELQMKLEEYQKKNDNFKKNMNIVTSHPKSLPPKSSLPGKKKSIEARKKIPPKRPPLPISTLRPKMKPERRRPIHQKSRSQVKTRRHMSHQFVPKKKSPEKKIVKVKKKMSNEQTLFSTKEKEEFMSLENKIKSERERFLSQFDEEFDF